MVSVMKDKEEDFSRPSEWNGGRCFVISYFTTEVGGRRSEDRGQKIKDQDDWMIRMSSCGILDGWMKNKMGITISYENTCLCYVLFK